VTGATLDTGALIAFERGTRRITALVEEARRSNVRLSVPAGVVAEAWRGGARQARLASLLRAAVTDVVVLDEIEARAVGTLCAVTGTSDVVDASVVVAARRAGQTIVTSDPSDIARLAPDSTIVVV
jgi:hypothetical protein